uniref:Uncharacterized protein n=1 Tax=Triticum urartu TaxID=4572 RepID=A0A8R7K2A0_TRIUA
PLALPRYRAPPSSTPRRRVEGVRRRRPARTPSRSSTHRRPAPAPGRPQLTAATALKPTKHSLSSACMSTYIATKQLQLHVLSMSRLSMSHMGTTMLGWEQLPNTPLSAN